MLLAEKMGALDLSVVWTPLKGTMDMGKRKIVSRKRWRLADYPIICC